MANRTSYLGLILPDNGEYTNTWDAPTNNNFETVDLAIDSVTTEVIEARFALPSLAQFLAVSILPDGTLKPTEEVTIAQNSLVYGSYDKATGEDYDLSQRIDLGDLEVFYGRGGEATLTDALAYMGQGFDYPDSVIFGANASGVPNFLSVSGDEFLLNGDPTEIVFNIGGRKMSVKDDISIQASGADGKKYLLANVPATPYVVKTGTAATTSQDAASYNKIRLFTDPAADFVASRVRKGMVLEVTTSTSQVKGLYIVDEVATGGDVRTLTVNGVFSTDDVNLAYGITDPLRPEFTVSDSPSITFGFCRVGQADFASLPTPALTSDITYAFKGKFQSPYTGVDAALAPGGIAELTFNHNLGYLPTKIEVFVSQQPDGSAYMEPLGLSDVGNDLGVVITNGQAFDPGTWVPAAVPGDQTPDYTPMASLTGTVTGTLNGTVYSINSVRVKATQTQLLVKNIKPTLLYTDYDGVVQSSGFVKVVIS